MTRIAKILEVKDIETVAHKKINTDLGLPRHSVLKRFKQTNKDYWVVIVEVNDKFYALDSTDQTWEDKDFNKIIKTVNKDTGISIIK